MAKLKFQIVSDWYKRASISAMAIALAACQPVAKENPGTDSETKADTPLTQATEIRAGLDRLPPDHQAVVEKYEQLIAGGQEPELIGVVDLIWKTEIVDVAFNGGDEETRKLIEDTVIDWTANSDVFKFNFRNDDGSFREWSLNDTDNDIHPVRIGFGPTGYWSYMGTVAKAVDANRPTMNFDGFPTDLKPYHDGKNKQAWAKSYERATILHEFGHALGLAHEHFHPNCQSDLIFDPDDGYVTTIVTVQTKFGTVTRYGPDDQGRSPGLIKYFKGLGWPKDQTLHNMDADTFLASTDLTVKTLNDVTDTTLAQSIYIDQDSVMLYSLPDYLFRSGDQSKCVAAGEGDMGDGGKFATRLSEGDIKYFQSFY